jgi:Protein of unknown function (DUF3606)
MIQYRRALKYSAEEWERLDRLSIDPMDSGHVGMLANLLMCHSSRIEEAVAKVGPKIRNIRRYLEQQPRPEPKPSRWRRRR